MRTECPQCKSPLTNEQQRFCYRCGQDLSTGREPGQVVEGAPKVVQQASSPASPTQDEVSGARPSKIEETTSEIASVESAQTVTGIKIETAQASLRIILPTGDVFDRELGPGETRIGKGPRNDLVVSDTAVSTTHAAIFSDSEGFSIKDLGSKNGTFVDTEKITAPRRLHHGDVITVGRSRLTFRVPSQSETAMLSGSSAGGSRPLTEKSLAEAIVEAGWTTRQQLDQLVSSSGGKRLANLVIAKKLGTEQSLRDLMSLVFSIKAIHLDDGQIDESACPGFPGKLAIDRTVFPVRRTDHSLLLAVFDPTDDTTIDEVKGKIGLEVEMVLATASEIREQALKRFGARLIGVSPSGERIERVIDLPDLEIGKAVHNQVVLLDPTVSNSHAVILARNGGYSIVDLGSTNGTVVSGERLGAQARTLRHGDTVQVGTTILTFRNPVESPENVTTILPANIAEEFRSRAATSASAQQAGPAPGPDEPPAQPAIPEPIEAAVPIPVPEQPQLQAAEAKSAERAPKSGKKKKKDDRIRAAYVSALGRIMAGVITAALTVGLAIYIRDYTSGSEKAKIEPSKKGKPKLKINEGGAGSSFEGGAFEASGVVQVPGSNGVLFVDDNRPGQVLWMQLDETGKQKGDIKPVDLGVAVDDPEAITYGNAFFYVVSSQSNPKSDGNSLVRFVFDSATASVAGKPDVIRDLGAFLLSNVAELKATADKSANEGGLDIEGLAWDPDHERLLLGLRSPLVNEQAIIIPLKLKDPHGAFSAENLQIGDPGPIHLSLGGLGVRDIHYDTRLNAFHLIAGEPEHHDKKTFALWEWDGNGGAGRTPSLTEETRLDPKMKPEGVCRVNIGGRDFVFIVGDASSYMKLDYATADQ